MATTRVTTSVTTNIREYPHRTGSHEHRRPPQIPQQDLHGLLPSPAACRIRVPSVVVIGVTDTREMRVLLAEGEKGKKDISHDG